MVHVWGRQKEFKISLFRTPTATKGDEMPCDPTIHISFWEVQWVAFGPDRILAVPKGPLNTPAGIQNGTIYSERANLGNLGQSNGPKGYFFPYVRFLINAQLLIGRCHIQTYNKNISTYINIYQIYIYI